MTRSVKRHRARSLTPGLDGPGPQVPALLSASSFSLSGLTGSAYKGSSVPAVQGCESCRVTMLAPGSGSEQRTRLALRWRQVSCEYGGVGAGRRASMACSDVFGLPGGLSLSGRPRAWLQEPRNHRVQPAMLLASVRDKERVAAESLRGWIRSWSPVSPHQSVPEPGSPSHAQSFQLLWPRCSNVSLPLVSPAG